ncbi:ribosomal-protein-alanine N-acetyltransferase [Elusimicrobium posterum]|uniref:ribosomal protein S18-alanine N-acetyltransferase n=1 Tax=Elusimicrobium posterum TaxID=3116653 RepID=UPI003C72D65F
MEVFLCTPGCQGALAMVEASQPHAAGWKEQGFKTELENNFAKIFAVKQKGEIFGFVAVRAVAGSAELLNFAVAKDCEGKGAGRALMQKMLAALKEENVLFVTLEVDKNNERALEFYKKSGFGVIGVRKNFYGAGRDAALMRMDL